MTVTFSFDGGKPGQGIGELEGTKPGADVGKRHSHQYPNICFVLEPHTLVDTEAIREQWAALEVMGWKEVAAGFPLEMIVLWPISGCHEGHRHPQQRWVGIRYPIALEPTLGNSAGSKAEH